MKRVPGLDRLDLNTDRVGSAVKVCVEPCFEHRILRPGSINRRQSVLDHPQHTAIGKGVPLCELLVERCRLTCEIPQNPIVPSFRFGCWGAVRAQKWWRRRLPSSRGSDRQAQQRPTLSTIPHREGGVAPCRPEKREIGTRDHKAETLTLRNPR